MGMKREVKELWQVLRRLGEMIFLGLSLPLIGLAQGAGSVGQDLRPMIEPPDGRDLLRSTRPVFCRPFIPPRRPEDWPKLAEAGKRWERTVRSVQALFGPRIEPLWHERFDEAGAAWPPGRLAIVVFKTERLVEIWATPLSPREASHYVHVYDLPMANWTGPLGPKLRQGDGHIPEGEYSLTWLHPNSTYHLAAKVNYPSAADREAAEADREAGRSDRSKELGGDIMIHGSNASIGCVALGDAMMEELFILIAKAGLTNVSLYLAPYDFRAGESDPRESLREYIENELSWEDPPDWLLERYVALRQRLREKFPRPPLRATLEP